MGLSDGSHPSRANEQYVQVAISSNSIVGVYFHPESTIYIKHQVCLPSEDNAQLYLSNLAFPALFSFVRPFICKCSFSSLDHPDGRRIFLAQCPILLLNCRNNRPATVWRMLQVLNQRIIIFLPSIQRFMAEEAGDIVGVALSWVVEETCFRELNAC
jgi:hypothetical protein